MEKYFGLRIDDKLLKKFHYVCAYEGRSANRQLLQLIIKCIAEYEQAHGTIELDDNTDTK